MKAQSFFLITVLFLGHNFSAQAKSPGILTQAMDKVAYRCNHVSHSDLAQKTSLKSNSAYCVHNDADPSSTVDVRIISDKTPAVTVSAIANSPRKLVKTGNKGQKAHIAVDANGETHYTTIEIK